MGRRDGAGAETLGAVVVAQGEGLPGLVGDTEVEGADGGTGCEDLTGGAGDDGNSTGAREHVEGGRVGVCWQFCRLGLERLVEEDCVFCVVSLLRV